MNWRFIITIIIIIIIIIIITIMFFFFLFLLNLSLVSSGLVIIYNNYSPKWRWLVLYIYRDREAAM